MKHRVVTALLAGILPTGPGADSAVAHDLVRRSEPVANAAVVAGPVSVAVVYSGKIDRARSQLALVAPSGTRRELALDGSAPPNVLQAPAPIDLTPGAYVLRWIVLSSDGHLSRGDIPFQVVPTGGPGSTSAPGR
jgi:methionine-rich copper-binding protein CopC